jgi:hypothetical protein
MFYQTHKGIKDAPSPSHSKRVLIFFTHGDMLFKKAHVHKLSLGIDSAFLRFRR